jgi:hypothetical protein
LNRELIELLNELRVALPGVQVLFAFLLILPFSRGFPEVTRCERVVYFAGWFWYGLPLSREASTPEGQDRR